MQPNRFELIAPAGDHDCAQAAIENGADAVYFGLRAGLNARARATNFTLEELPDLLDRLHHRGLKGYLTLNTLVFSSELDVAEQTIRAAAQAGIDALLVQDLGLTRLAKAVCPELPLHASTQMTITSAECLAVARRLGIERVVLARELSLDEIAAIRREAGPVELEAFVHGALCVAYSGQCLTSESLGGRSANRGQCAQACRMPYRLVCDGQERDLADQKYLLSPQDLAAYDLIPALVRTGVTSFKIEGRLKAAEYVANITRQYRRALDAAAQGESLALSPQEVEEMEVSFSRGFSHGWLEGANHKTLVPGFSSAKRGVLLGEVIGSRKGRVAVRLASSVKRGDGVVFEGDRVTNAEQGGRVYEVFQGAQSLTEPALTGQVELSFRHGAIDPERLWIGQKVWKTDDPALTRRLRRSFTGAPQRRMPVDVVAEAKVGQPLRIVATTASGRTCRLESADPLAEAIRHPLAEPMLREQLGRLGGTVYELGNLEARIEGRPMVPLSVLGKLRHAMVEQLDAAATSPDWAVRGDSMLVALRRACPAATPGDSAPGRAQEEPAAGGDRLVAGADVQLHLLCRSLLQVETALKCDQGSLLADFADIRQYAAAVALARESGARIALATPRIQKPGEMGIFHALLRHRPDGVLVRNLAGLAFFVRESMPVVADFSLNATNELTFDWLLAQGAARVTASFDLNRDQLLDLVAAVPPARLEVVVHQHMPMFHNEHCVFCAVLSPGTNHTNCGRPCDRHRVELRDRIGMDHLLLADVGCRNTLFNARPQSGAEVVPSLVERGVRHFRVELLDENDGGSVRRILDLYRALLAGRTTGSQVWSELKAANRVGVTRGTLEERRHPDALL